MKYMKIRVLLWLLSVKHSFLFLNIFDGFLCFIILHKFNSILYRFNFSAIERHRLLLYNEAKGSGVFLLHRWLPLHKKCSDTRVREMPMCWDYWIRA